MIAVPIKMNKEESAVSPLFGKAKWFAVLDNDGNLQEIVENVTQSGVDIMNTLISKNITTMLVSHIGKRPLIMAQHGRMEVFYVGKDRIMLKESFEKFKNNELPNAKDIPEEDLFAHHGHSHGDHDHHHHH